MSAVFAFEPEARESRGWGVVRESNALALLVAGALPAITSPLISSLRGAVVTLLVELALLPFARSPRRTMLVRTALILLTVASLVWSNWLLGNHRIDPALTAGLRVACIGLPGLFLSAHIRPFPLGDALIQQARLPARGVLAVVAALQRAALIADDWDELGVVRRARGLGGAGPMAYVRELLGRGFALMVLSIRGATEVATAMDVRGMGAWRELGVARGTWETSRWRRRDTALVTIGAAVAVLPLVVR
jgi:energy-coupling factor transporter transmembrane protein EcfT